MSLINFDGKAASFLPGKESANKEPSISKFVVEKLYRVHRQRILKMSPMVDCRVEIPDFVGDTSWKKIAAQRHQQVIARENEEIYRRILKHENEETALTKETREHNKRVNEIKSHDKRLKDQERYRKALKIQKENELLLQRIERARPEYTKKSITEWYAHHVSFKEGRRSDPTAGHIMKGMGDVAPSLLPPFSVGDDMSMSLWSSNDSMSTVSTQSKTSLSSIAASQQSGSWSAYLSSKQSAHSNNSISKVPLSRGVSQSVDTALIKRKKKRKNKLKPISIDLESFEPIEENNIDYDIITDDSPIIKFENPLTQELLILVSKHNIPIPFEDIRADIAVCCHPSKDDSLIYIQVKCMSEIESDVYIERIMTVAKIEEILGNISLSSIAQVVEFNDLKTLRKILLDVFNEMDKDRKGYITFDDFFAIMDKFDLSISPQQLRFVVSDADENEDGVIDVMEYIPLSVDVILTFGARNKAKIIINEEGSLFTAEIYKNVSLEGIDALTQIVMGKIKELDPTNSGMIHINQFRKILNSLGSSGPSEMETVYICENLRKDTHNKVRYQNLNTVFHDAKLLSERIKKLKQLDNAVLNSTLDLCEEAEASLRNVSIREDEVKTGFIPFRNFMKILTTFREPSLSRLQILVIMSEVEADRDINYYEFLPFVTKSIELFFEPKALLQRAELIDQTDMSVEGLLSSSQQGLNADVFEKHLKTLFKSSDLDHNNSLEEPEFIRCLLSLDLGLDDNEIRAMMAKADIDGSKVIDFDEFLSFFKTNLPDMEKEKHIRLMKAAVHHKHGNKRSSMHLAHHAHVSRSATPEYKKKDYTAHLETVFALEDKQHTGLLDKAVIEKIIYDLDLKLSHFQLQVLLSELATQGDNKVRYKQFTPIIADILHTYERNLSLNEEMHKLEEDAHHKADRILRSTAMDVQHIVEFLKDRIRIITETIDLPKQQHLALKEVLFNPHSGLSRVEANSLLEKLLPDNNIRLKNLKMAHIAFPGHHSGGRGSLILHKSISMNVDGTPNLEELAKTVVNSPNRHAPVISSKKRRAQGSFKANRRNSQELASAVEEFQNHGHHDKNHGHHDNHHGHHDNDFRSKGREITLQDLTDYIVEVRKASIMRNLMNKVNKNDLDVEVLDLLIKAAKEEGIDSSSNFLPVRVCFQALEKSKKFRLTRPQAMSIVSWATCYDSEHKNLNMAAFAKYAAGMIAKILGGEMMEQRATALDEYHSIEAMDIMQGLTENELKDYYEEAFMYVDNGDGEVDITQFSQIIQWTPKVSLESGEIAALVAACRHTASNKINWKDFINFSYNTILTICREREVGMRLMKNAVVDLKALIISAENDHPEVKEENPRSVQDDLRKLENYRMLAARIIEMIKIKYVNNSFVINLPSDQVSRRQTVRTPKSDSLVHLGITDQTLGITEIGRFMKFLPMKCINGKVQVEKHQKLGAFLRIMTIDTNMANRIILVNIMSADGKFYTESSDLPLQLPMAAAVDRETAEVFVEGLLDMFFIEVIDENNYRLSVNVN